MREMIAGAIATSLARVTIVHPFVFSPIIFPTETCWENSRFQNVRIIAKDATTITLPATAVKSKPRHAQTDKRYSGR